MMRFSLILLIFFAATGCSGQQTKGQQSHVDTAKLFDPFPEQSSAQDVMMFKNSIVLFHSDFTIVHNETEKMLNTMKEVSDYFAKNAAAIRQNKYYLLIDSTTKFEKTVSVINILKKNSIDNYKVVNVQEYFKAPEPITLQTPTVVTKTVDKNDSTYLLIEISENTYKLSLLDKEAVAINGSDIDKFITQNKSLINSGKILMVTRVETPSEKMKPVLEVLKKHNYMKFQMVTQPTQ